MGPLLNGEGSLVRVKTKAQVLNPFLDCNPQKKSIPDFCVKKNILGKREAVNSVEQQIWGYLGKLGRFTFVGQSGIHLGVAKELLMKLQGCEKSWFFREVTNN